VRIAISKTGEMLNPDLNYVEISMGSRTTDAGEELPPAFIAADEALVALELEMTVFNVDREEHASRIARKEIGQRLDDIPLKVLEVVEVESDDEEADEEDGGDDAEADNGGDDPEADDGNDGSGGGDASMDGDASADDDDLLPEFEDMVEE